MRQPTTARVERVRELSDEGAAPADIATKLGGLTVRRVQQLLKIAGVARRSGRPQIHPPRHLRISYRRAGAA